MILLLLQNCHKWLSGKRSCAVLYVPERQGNLWTHTLEGKWIFSDVLGIYFRNQHIIKTSIPTSDAYIPPVNRKTPTSNFVEQFECKSDFLSGFFTLSHMTIQGMVRLIGRLSSQQRTVRIFLFSLVCLFTPFLFLALEFRQWLGGEHKINDYCHNLAVEGGKKLADLWGTRLMDPTGEFTLNMVCPLLCKIQGTITFMYNFRRR